VCSLWLPSTEDIHAFGPNSVRLATPANCDTSCTFSIGLLAGVVARFLLPGPNNPQGFVLTSALGIAAAFVSTWIGQSIGWYRPDQGAGVIGPTLGGIIVLSIWHRLAVQRVITDPGVSCERLVSAASLTSRS
jgi:uncharacterized membrane protein YeaQ/YmgE (transglycosylase-associated protein family)